MPASTPEPVAPAVGLRRVRLLLPHPPLSKPRPRATIQGRIYMPERYRAWQEAVLLDAGLQFAGEPLHGPLQMTLIVEGPSRGRGDLEGYFGALADTIGGNRHANAPGLVFDDDDQIIRLAASFTPAPDWCLDVTIDEMPPLTYPKPSRARKAAKP